MVLDLHKFNDPENEKAMRAKLKDPHSHFGLDKQKWIMLVNEV